MNHSWLAAIQEQLELRNIIFEKIYPDVGVGLRFGFNFDGVEYPAKLDITYNTLDYYDYIHNTWASKISVKNEIQTKKCKRKKK